MYPTNSQFCLNLFTKSKGISGTIDKFPEYKSDPLRLVVRVNKSKDKEAFR